MCRRAKRRASRAEGPAAVPERSEVSEAYSDPQLWAQGRTWGRVLIPSNHALCPCTLQGPASG